MSAAPKKILVVDDNSAHLSLINGILSSHYKVYPVDSGATALRFLDKHTPDLILLDVEMPKMSGPELLRVIKSNSRLSDIPVIFLTSNTSMETEISVFRLGAADYIHKPVNDVIVSARVKTHLELAAYRKLGISIEA